MFFNSEDARNRACERVARFHEEAAIRRFTAANPKQTVARFIRQLAANLERNSQGDSHVSPKISRDVPL